MFKNKNKDGSLNICGAYISILRKKNELSQRELADKMQLQGMDFTKNTIQQIEKGKRFVTDIELKSFAKYFDVSVDELLSE